ncbi:hypothetical protein [Sphingomonas abietis]|uniref:Uncharacterized protein n=1 Tax=Sphingomonas abietis TaxID=3012344 RepID=A0ABY7NM11_9SPHN|nr:hypothetical protein [Sphingomonas abietis]WBO21511.1 hypothetical protein PBT88_15165 [Sphingomonas abietis]
MYDLIDRPVALLAPGGRFMLWAMRGWIQSATKGHCPPGALAPAFARHGALPALPHFHMLLAELNHRAIRQIAFSPLPCGLIGEDEAVLLQLCRDACDNPPHARATLELLLEEEAVGTAFGALLSATTKLKEVGLADIAFEQDRATGLR